LIYLKPSATLALVGRVPLFTLPANYLSPEFLEIDLTANYSTRGGPAFGGKDQAKQEMLNNLLYKST
jgi:hypothetical protein